jgi:hypothetical protein
MEPLASGAQLTTSATAVRPEATDASFFPLAIGNHWHYVRSFTVQILPTPGPSGIPETLHSTMDATLVGTEVLFGRLYVVEEDVIHESGRDFTSLIRYRQDASGLYEADVTGEPQVGMDSSEAPTVGIVRANGPSLTPGRSILAGVPADARHEYARAWDDIARKRAAVARVVSRLASISEASRRPGGVLEGEITRLRYPLRPGAGWFIRNDPDLQFVALVEGLEVLELADQHLPSHRIRIDVPGVLGAGDRVVVWYGRGGFLRLFAHLSGVATDDGGNVVGTIVSEQSELLDSLELIEAGSR